MHTTLKPDSPEFLQAMGGLLSKAMETPEGMRAIAAAIAAPIEQEIAIKEIGSLMLTKHLLPVGERAIYQKRPKVAAYWISPNGTAVQSLIEDIPEVEVPTHRIASTPMVDVSVLKHGNMPSLVDVQKQAAEEIRKKIDRRVLEVISAAVPAENTVEQTGTTLEETTLNAALALLEDKELTVKTIILRGKRFADMRAWDLDPNTRLELRQKGIVKVYGGADILLTSVLADDEVLLLPDEEIGKMPVKTKLTVEPITDPLNFRTGWLVWMEIGMGVLRPDCLAKIKIVG
jgi:hypothetical protein